MKTSSKVILSIDPSFTATGWAILSMKCLAPPSQKNDCTYRLVDYGWIKTAKNKKVPTGVDDVNRARQIATELFSQMRINKVNEIWSEIPLGSQSANAAKALGIAKGIVAAITCMDTINQFYCINPFQIKIALCGNKNAKKEKVIAVVEKVFPVLHADSRRKKKTGKFSLFHEAVCDAIAVALAIKKRSI